VRITYIEIKRFKHFRLTGITKLAMRPNEPIQLILGTNGSGKSSFMNEVTPLPAEQSNYHKDGYKIIHITNKNNHYILKSEFSISHPHSFIVNDSEELNPGGTITVQRELVRQHFGITPEIHSLLMGNESFTGMSYTRRREWFTLLSEVSYDYSLSVYAKLKERYRDTSGALKHAKKRLVNEKSKQISDAELTKLKVEVAQIHTELDVLYQNRNTLVRDEDTVSGNFRTNQTQLQQLISQFEKLKLGQPNTGNWLLTNELVRNEWGELVPINFRSKEEIDSAISDIRSEISFKEKLIQDRENQFTEIKKKISVLEKTGVDDVNTLKEKIRLAEVKITKLEEQRLLKLDNLFSEQAIETFEAVSQSLFEIFSVMPPNGDRKFSSSRLRDLTEVHKRLSKFINGENNHCERLRVEIQHLEKHKDIGNITCPSCKHRWNPVLTENDLPKLKETLSQKLTVLEETEKLKRETEKDIEENQNYGDLFKRYLLCVRNTPGLFAFWDYLNAEDLVYSSPRRIIQLIDEVKHDLHLEAEIHQERKNVLGFNELIIAAMTLGNESLTELKDKVTELEAEIEKLTRALSYLKQNLNICQGYRKTIFQAEGLKSRIETLMTETNTLKEEWINSIRCDCINLCIREHQSNLAVKEGIISSITTQQNLIKDLENQITTLSQEEEVTKHLINELSPTNGLIAEGLLGFIRFFLKRLNSIIKKIWTYPMVVEACHIGEGEVTELDYKFPVRIHHAEKSIDDVRLGSTGMREVFDLAFKLCAMHFLSLDHIPLVLDEFGRTMDKVHKEHATNFIQQLLNQSTQPQIFMVSHDLLQYGSISNVDVCVLCPANIVVPDKYNKHVVIEM